MAEPEGMTKLVDRGVLEGDVRLSIPEGRARDSIGGKVFRPVALNLEARGGLQVRGKSIKSRVVEAEDTNHQWHA